jgi:hypothetical protein
MLTGASLWSAEVLMAELTATMFSDFGGQEGVRPKVIELGCGSSPLAGLVASSLGFDVVLTDMPVVLRGAMQNVSHNYGTVEKHAEKTRGLGRLEACTLWWGEELSGAAQAFAPFNIVLCADCLYKGELYDPLASTLAQLLAPSVEGTSPSQALFVYQRRQNETDERSFFTHTLPKYGLDWRDGLVDLDKNFIKSSAAFNWLMRRIDKSNTVDPASFFDVRLVFRSDSRRE